MVKQEDQRLAGEQFSALNKKFYQGSPHEYFNRRLHSLLLSVADSEMTRAALAEGIRFGSLSVRSADSYDQVKSENYAAIESTVLFHHAAEALMRLYLAHCDLSPCPWLEVARLRNFSEFKGRLDKLSTELANDAEGDRLLDIFRGSGDPEELELPATSEELNADRHGLISFIRYIARRLLDEGNLYNSAKHGLAISGGNVGIEFGTESLDAPIIAHSGPSLTYLEVVTGENNTKTWAQTIKWVRTSANLGLIHLIASQIESLWNVARARYTTEVEFTVHPVPKRVLDSILKADMVDDFNIEGMSFPLYYYREGPE